MVDYDAMAACARSNGSRAGNEFHRLWVQGCMDAKREEQDWIARLRAEGAKAAHPDDGWVDRAENSIAFTYPQFNDGADVGDVVALGWPGKHRLVRIVGLKDCVFFDRWLFEPA